MTIINADALDTARLRWHGANPVFDHAARVLDYATCQSDVYMSLRDRTYTFNKRSHHSQQVVDIIVGSHVMLSYVLTEVGQHADVEIIIT